MRTTWRQRPRRLLAATLGVLLLVGLVVSGGLLATGGTLQVLLPRAEPPPQAPASAPEPTLVSAEATAQAAEGAAAQLTPATTPESSPFAGISQPPPQPPERSGLVHHTVTEGEVLWQVAEQYNLRPETVLWANDIQDPDLLLIGQDLLIPPTDGVLYTVRSGDRLADVANHYGVDLQAIINTNHLDDADQIQAGSDIFLPGGRPISANAAQASSDDQEAASNGQAIVLPDNIDAMLNAGWLTARGATDLFKTAASGSSPLDQVPPGARLERVGGVTGGRIQVRDPGDGQTRQAMTGWINAGDLDVGRAPSTRELPQAYPSDTAMDIFHVFAPYRSQLDGSPYAEANCGPTTLGMALDAFGVSVPPRQLRAEALEAQHMYGNGVGTLITALAQVAQQHGLQALDLRGDNGGVNRWNLDDIRSHLQQEQPVIVQVRYRLLPGRGGAYYFGDHYILVTGIVGDGFLYNDPISIDGLGWDRVISSAALDNAMNASDARYSHAAVAIAR
jgi:LysM repeat protein